MEEFIAQVLVLAKGIWKHRLASMAAAWLVLIVGSAAVYSVPSQYSATARVFVDTESILKPLLAGMTTVPNVEQQVSIMSRTLITRPNVEKVIRMVDLDLKSKTVREHETMVDDLMKNIKIAGMAQNDIYTITYNDTRPKEVRDVVQAFLTIFVEGSFGGKQQDSAKAIIFINDQIKVYEAKLSAAEAALKDFKLKNAGLLPRQGGDYGSKLTETADTLSQTRLDLREAEQTRNAIEREIAAIPPGAMAEPVAGAPYLSNTETRIRAVSQHLDTLRLQLTEDHPDIVADRRLLRQLEASEQQERAGRTADGSAAVTYSPILQQMKMSLSNAVAKVAALRARVDEYAARTARLREANLEAPAVEQQLAQLNRDYMINKENYEKLVSSRESAKLSGELSATTEMMTFRVIDPPTLPLTPTGPNRLRLLSLVFGAALILGALAGAMMSMIRPTFTSKAGLRSACGLPVLGSVGLYWTPDQRDRQRKQLLYVGASLALLVLVYAGLMTPLIRQL